MLSGKAVIIDGKSKETGKSTKYRNDVQSKKSLPFFNPIVHPACAIKRSSLIAIRGYLGGINCEDYDLWLRFDRDGKTLIMGDFFAIKYRLNEFQVKGSRIAYADAVGLRLRECLYRGSFNYLLSTLYGVSKFFTLILLRKVKR